MNMSQVPSVVFTGVSSDGLKHENGVDCGDIQVPAVSTASFGQNVVSIPAPVAPESFTAPTISPLDSIVDPGSMAPSSGGSGSLKRPTKSAASDWTELQVLFRGSLPLIACQLIFQSMTLVDQIVLGQLTGQEGLSVAAFGQLFFNTCWFWLVGMTTNLDTILSRCQGASMIFHVHLWLQRGFIFLFLVQIPFACLFFNSTSILKGLGQDEALARSSEEYIRVLFFALFPQGLVFVLIKYLSLNGLQYPQVHLSWVAAGVNIALDFVLIRWLGPVGAAWATLISRWLQLLLLVLYIYAWEDLRGALWLSATELKALLPAGSTESIARFRWQLLAERSSVSSLSYKMLKGGVMMLLEGWAFELSVLLVGALQEGATLSAHFIMLQFTAWTYIVVAFSVGTATNMRVAFLIGSGQHQEMRRTARCAMVLAAAPMLAIAVAMLGAKSVVGRLWTADAEVVEVVERVVPIAAAFQVLDGVQAAVAAMIRGIEGRGRVAVSNFLGFWCCGSAVALLLHFERRPDVVNAWYGLLAGLGVVTLLHGGHVARVDWREEVSRAQELLAESYHDCVRLLTREPLLQFGELFPEGFHINQDCVIPFKWAARKEAPAAQRRKSMLPLSRGPSLRSHRSSSARSAAQADGDAGEARRRSSVFSAWRRGSQSANASFKAVTASMKNLLSPGARAGSRRAPTQVYVAYIGLDNVASSDHVHVAGHTDNILVFHSLIIANRQLLLLMAATVMEAHLKQWKRFVLQVFRGRSGPAMVMRLELALEALGTAEGRKLVKGLEVQILRRERMSGHDAPSESFRRSAGAGSERDLAALAERVTASKPFRAMRYTLRVGAREVAMRVWVGYRGMEHMFEQTADEDAGVFLGVSGVNGPQSAALILPQPEALYTYIRPSLSVFKVNAPGIENGLTRLIPDLTESFREPQWAELNDLARGVTCQQLQQKMKAAKGCLSR